MQASQIPAKIQEAFAVNGQRNVIPVPSQASTTPGAASFNDGFPPLTMQPLSTGGVPPSGKDFNGILYAITSVLQWECAGGFFAYDAAWSSANGGYPKGAILQSAGTNDLWLNQVDGNTTNPDATDGSGTNWVSLASYGIGVVTGLTNANITLTPTQYSKRIITLAGALTGNVQIIVPNALRDYTFINNTTGAYTVTVKTAAGTGVAVPQGGSQQVYCDGVNIQAVGLTQAAADARYAALAGNANQTFSAAKGGATGQVVTYDQALGLGQTLQNVLASRASGTTYTNTTSKPIAVTIGVYVTSSTQWNLLVNGIICGDNGSAGSAIRQSITVIVPPGGTYSLNVPTGPITIITWVELR